MHEKRKAERRLHPLMFFIGWSGILIVGWVFTILSIFEMSWFLPSEARYFFRRNLPFEVREAVVVTSFIAMGLAIPIAQRYLLNRSFGLRLSWWWVVVTFFGYAAGHQASNQLGFLIRISPTFVANAVWYVPVMGIPAVLQWWLLRKRWQYAWLWIVMSIISGYFVFVLMSVVSHFDPDWYLFIEDGIEMIPSGLAHGLLTGITALALDWITRRKTLEKNKFADI